MATYRLYGTEYNTEAVMEFRPGVKLAVLGPSWMSNDDDRLPSERDSDYYMFIALIIDGVVSKHPPIELTVEDKDSRPMLCIYKDLNAQELLHLGIGVDMEDECLRVASGYLEEPVTITPNIEDYSFRKGEEGGKCIAYLLCRGSIVCAFTGGGVIHNEQLRLGWW